ncbi:MAG: hypothetical protein F6K54_36735 [Okeania sp. SIO3B5]|uniref:hypothetical protein n=1 Tax=Okeania sp. SIO3B5 TaxID=2607811 RepID=UPI0013FF4770|nr:hypothetical protein [Okeania sp. SIO3B5]NEO58117.1 hypothetical protein [Okeania sp. SIO3B5]
MSNSTTEHNLIHYRTYQPNRLNDCVNSQRILFYLFSISQRSIATPNQPLTQFW